MRVLLIVGWLLIPVGVCAWHYGPGQEQVLLDNAADSLRAADGLLAEKEYAKAADKFDEALKLLPPDRSAASRRIRLERSKAQMQSQQLPKAHQDLAALVEEMTADSKANAKVLADAQTALASSRYYMTWLMRLEGLSRETWEPEIELSRQTYRMLAEQAESQGDQSAARQRRHDLEAAIRLARMDLSELQGLPLPSQ